MNGDLFCFKPFFLHEGRGFYRIQHIACKSNMSHFLILVPWRYNPLKILILDQYDFYFYFIFEKNAKHS